MWAYHRSVGLSLILTSLRHTQHKKMRLARSDFLTRLLVSLPVTMLSPAAMRPASALVGEVIGEGFTQADDKSWDFTLPSTSWKLAGEAPWRAEHPKKLFHVTGTRSGGSAFFDLSVELSGAKTLSDLGKPSRYGEKVAPAGASLTSAQVITGFVKGSTLLDLRYESSKGSTAYRVVAKQGRTYTMAVSLPSQPDETAQAEARALLESFKAFPINIICTSQSNGGTSPVPGSCY